MKCKYCKSVIENGSLYCRFCGAQLFKAQKKEMPVPKPRQLSDGRWMAQLMVDGKRHTVYGITEEEYTLRARALKAKLLTAKSEPPKLFLGTVIDKYIDSNENVLSPSTIRGYRMIRKHYFQDYMNMLLANIDWQVMVNEAAKTLAPKTVKNAWGLVSASLAAIGAEIPEVNLPEPAKKETPFLNYVEIQTFLDAVRGKPCELAAILALHSLRRSELFALNREDIHDGFIYVGKAYVPDETDSFVLKYTTKTPMSTRKVPVMIPRLLEILPESEGRLITDPPSTAYSQINRICAKAGLPQIGYHGLRRSFASLGYHLKWSERTVMRIGGWSNIQTVHKFYIKLAEMDVNDDIKAMQAFYGFTTESP